SLLGLLALTLGGSGCSSNGTLERADGSHNGRERSTNRGTERTQSGIAPDVQEVVPEKLPPDVKRASLGEHVWLETQGDQRRVRVEAQVCQPAYSLEFFLTRPEFTYESLLVTKAKAKNIHAALIAAHAETGSPIRFGQDTFHPPTGTPIRISLEYRDK